MAGAQAARTPAGGAWPALPLDEWTDTRDTFQLWTQVVGKVRMARAPLENHWWNVALYVTARGLTTSPVPAGARSFQIDLDLLDHRLAVTTTDGEVRSMALEPRSVADFHAELVAHLDDLDLATPIWTMPVEIEGAIPFEADHDHASYDADQVQRFWLALVRTHHAFQAFRAGFVGKCSPVHLFWGGLDLAVTRFSGRTAPPHPGGAPNCGPHVMLEAYSHEVSSAGYWPGGGGEGVFYSYAYPEPPGYRDVDVSATGGRFDAELGEFTLPYEAVRTAEDPEAVLGAFLQRTYEAAADTAAWDRAALERPPG
jgi:hypothetical protein